MAYPNRGMSGIAPKIPQAPMLPAGGSMRAPSQKPSGSPQHAAAAPAPAGNTGVVPPQYNPAARDAAIRNLAAPAATTPAPAPTPAAAPPGAQTMGATAAGVHPLSPQAQDHVQQFVSRFPQMQQLVDAIRSAETPEDRMGAIHTLLSQLTPEMVAFRENGGSTPNDNSEYERAHDEFERRDAEAAETQPDTEGPDEDAAESRRIKRIRQRRMGRGPGIFTGSPTVG